MVVHGDAGLLQAGAEMAHRAEEECQPELVGADMGGFLLNLGHPDRIPAGVEPVEGRGFPVELVTEDQHQASHGRVSRRTGHAQQ